MAAPPSRTRTPSPPSKIAFDHPGFAAIQAHPPPVGWMNRPYVAPQPPSPVIPAPPAAASQVGESAELRSALASLRTAVEHVSTASPSLVIADKDAKLYTDANLKVTAKLGTPYLPVIGESNASALLTISTPADVGLRTPFELVILLDNSGSMGGERIINAKAAIKQIVGNLSEKDLLHFVTYASAPRVVFENGKLLELDRLLTQVEAVTALDSTNISAGLVKAFSLLAGKASSSRRIFLFSDGEANAGVMALHELEQVVKFIHRHGVNVTSFGIGNGYNEKLMRGIATAGHGDFFYIEKPQDITSIVSKGMSVLTTLVASNLTLQLTSVSNASIRDIVGYSSNSLAALGDISSDDLRQILVRINIPSPAAPRTVNSTSDIFYYRLSFIVAGDAQPNYVQGTVSCIFTDETAKLSGVDSDVRVALATASASALDAVVYDLLAGGKIEGARERKSAAIKMLEDVEAIDNSGFVKHLIALGKAALAGMQAKSVDVAGVQRAVHWTGGAHLVHRKCF